MTSISTHECLVDHILIKDGREILEDELLSPVFSNLSENEERIPTFLLREVRFGKILGLGAFGVVREVKDIDLLDESRYSMNTSKTSECTHSSETIHSDPQFDSDEIVTPESGVFNDSLVSRNDLAALCIRNGESRYAVKYLMTEDASAEQQARARIDLGIEIHYLRALSHPNIIKIRGLLKTQQLFDPKLFFLMDRLYGTLHDKIGKWKESVEIKNFQFMRCLLKPFRYPKNYHANREFMKERLFIAHDIASALTYMHHNKVIHRDIKKQNIGFDIRGNVKVFDFGLAKSLREDRLSHCDYYKLTGNVGSIPYMAPEVALTKPYNEKCDVYSYGILLYEIISLRPPFSPAINTKYKKAVVQGGRRPRIKKKWPSMANEVMKSSWMTSPLERPNMKTIYSMIKLDLKVLETEENIESHIACMANISRHSSSKYFNLNNLSLEESQHKCNFF